MTRSSPQARAAGAAPVVVLAVVGVEVLKAARSRLVGLRYLQQWQRVVHVLLPGKKGTLARCSMEAQRVAESINGGSNIQLGLGCNDRGGQRGREEEGARRTRAR